MSSADSDEQDLVARAVSGDRDALDTLLRAHVQRVHAVCLRMVGNHHDAMDASQHALIAAARAITRFDGRSSFSTWIHRIAVNASLDELRRRQRRPRPVEELPESQWSRDDVTGTDARMVIDAAMRTIPEEFRVALVLRDLVGYDYREIAELLDVPIGTVRSRIARGRAALSAQLGEPIDPSGTSK